MFTATPKLDYAPVLDDEQAGNFDDGQQLLALFGDPDARGHRKWAEMFDPAACQEANVEAILSELPKL
ncbi:hypothetical protein [Sphingomicrobium aestuariivivum]|uniref:hypothetical protein n=1 Tax=Sphingomicrobium aestuariivivum TaxID=1582356 RepID=UPI001FD6C267|nr:hypothetical protein [Sphingomicrobium aestuariivivum]MCJ8190474.1 hypothetical protein [Sphingomicrobium aestuariivivum]